MKLEPFDTDKIKEYPPCLIFDGHRMCRWWVAKTDPELLHIRVLNGAWNGRYYYETKKFVPENGKETTWVDHEFQRVVELSGEERLQWYVDNDNWWPEEYSTPDEDDRDKWHVSVAHMLETPHWPKGLVPGSRKYRPHDSPDGEDEGIFITVGGDGDVWMRTHTEKPNGSVHYTCTSGGGQSPRVRQALVLLALAIQLDNENDVDNTFRRNRRCR